MEFSESLVNGFVGGQLVSSILAVSCVSVAFCANMIMVQDKVNGSIHDLMITPVKPSVLAFGYYLANFITTLLVSFCAVIAGLIFMAVTGWYMSVADIFGLFLDVVLLTMFGTAISSVVSFCLKSQGQISAVSAIISAGYGFLCGAYMPISQLSKGVQYVILFARYLWNFLGAKSCNAWGF